MRRRWVLIPVFIIAGVAGFWFEAQSRKDAVVNNAVNQSAVLTIVVRSAQNGNALPWLPITIQRTDDQASNQAPAVTTIQSTGSGTVTTVLPIGRYTILSSQTSRYIGTVSVDLRENSTAILNLFDPTSASNLNTNAS